MWTWAEWIAASSSPVALQILRSDELRHLRDWPDQLEVLRCHRLTSPHARQDVVVKQEEVEVVAA